MEFDDRGRLDISAVYANSGHEVQLTLDVPGGLKPEEVKAHREYLETTGLLHVFDPDAALAGLREHDEEDNDDDLFDEATDC